MNITRIPPNRIAHRSRRRPTTRTALVLSVVDTRTGTLHRVLVEAAALHRRSGRYPALCGTEVVAASLTTPAVADCRDCAARLQQFGAVPDPEPRRPLRRWLRGPRPAHQGAAR